MLITVNDGLKIVFLLGIALFFYLRKGNKGKKVDTE